MPLVAAAAVAAGAALQSATGFGFSIVAAPLVFAVVEPEEAVGLLIVLGSLVNVLTLVSERRRPRPVWRECAVLLAFALPGAVAGVAVLRALDPVALQIAVSVGVVATLLARKLAQGRETPAWAGPIAGLAAGALTTSTTTAGPPLIVYLLGRRLEPVQVRDTMPVCFLGLSVVGVIALVVTGTSGAVPGRRARGAARAGRGRGPPRRPPAVRRARPRRPLRGRAHHRADRLGGGRADRPRWSEVRFVGSAAADCSRLARPTRERDMAQAHGDRLTAVDASFLAQESQNAHMHIGAVMVFEGPPPAFDDFADHVRGRLHLVPRYRQKLACPAARDRAAAVGRRPDLQPRVPPAPHRAARARQRGPAARAGGAHPLAAARPRRSRCGSCGSCRGSRTAASR